MRALTLWQPWASLVAAGGKRFETRGWGTYYRGPILIHAAGKRISNTAPADAETWRAINRPAFVEHTIEVLGHADLERLPYGAIVAECILDACKQVPPLDQPFPWGDWPRQRLEREALFGDHSPGRFVWLLASVHRLEIPIYAAGRQGLWTPDVDLVARVFAAPKVPA